MRIGFRVPHFVPTFTTLLCAVLVAVGCARPAPEQRLRDTMAELQAAIDARDAGEVADFLAADFIGNDGMDRDTARRLAVAVFLQHRDVGARIGPVDVAMSGNEHATVGFTAAMTGGSGGLLPDSAQVYRVRTGWRIEDGDWRITSAEWEPQL